VIIEQMELFHIEPEQRQPKEVLNGFYYEQSSRKFVSFVLGRRHYEILASRCRHDKQWQEKIKKERFIP